MEKTKEAEAAAQEERRQREATTQEKRRRIDQARANKPKACGHCGNALSPENEYGTCPSCGFEFSFDEISEVYSFQEPKESLTAQFSRHMKNKGKGQSAVMESVS
jgi:RNA polymerase subunit RPABC4/transcription elongation factor Spt4